ncbi:MAG: c-type cytochrome, partial [Cytophagales bacterium]
MLIFLLGTVSSYSQDDAAIANGKAIFENNCKSCHAVHEKVVGPALKGIMDRRDMPWLISWVKNPQRMIDSKDEYAVKIYNEYKSAGIMTGFAGLKDKEIENIFAYVVDEQETGPVVANVVTTGDPSVPQASRVDNSLLNTILIAFIAVIAVLILVLLAVLNVLRKYLVQRETELTEEEAYLVNQKFSLKPIFESTGFKFTLTFLVIGFIGKSSLDWMMGIGMQQGYAPKQPIAFSHKLHAGQYGINCNYCHTGVQLGKHANIPSANICMNCHGQIKTDSPKLTKLRESWSTGKPIEWVRVHNLPDLSYFNHAQHV